MKKRIRLGIFASHPIQYHVPIWRTLAGYSELEVKVHYFSDHSVRGGIDPEFGVAVKWDTPMLEGYDYEFIRRDADMKTPWTFLIPQLRERLKKERFDWLLIPGYAHPFTWQLLYLAHSLGIKVLMRGEFTDLKEFPAPLWKKSTRDLFLRWTYSQVDAFGVVGMQAKQHLLRFGIPENKLFFSPYSVDDIEFLRQKKEFSREKTREELGVEPDTFVFLFSGKLIPRKGILSLVEAFSHLPRANKAALLILGDGEQREQVLSRGRELLGNRLLFQGFINQTQLGKYFLAADAFVLPSLYEAWGLVTNEAMVFELPLLLSHMIGAHRDLLEHDRTGYLFQAGDVSDLARAMHRMMQDPAHAKEMGQQAFRVIQRYTIEASASGLRDAILATHS